MRSPVLVTTVAIFFALALSVSAQAEDVVVPEQDVEPISFLETKVTAQTAAEVAENAAAHEEATDYLKKAGANACKSLADSAEKAVVDNVKAQQAILDKIDKGADCPDEGQPAIKEMEKKLTEAKDAQKDADKAYKDALNSSVNFGSHKFNDLTKGNCAIFFNSAAYTNAEKKVADAKTKADQAAGTVAQATKAVQAAKDAAKVAVRLCQCNTYKAHKAALKAANEKVVSANTKEWKKAANLKCVLAGKSVGSCTVPPLPKVKATSVAKGVDSTKCEKWWAGAPIPKGCDTGYESYKNSHGAVGTYGGWTSVLKSGGANTKGKKFKLIRLTKTSGFSQNNKASMDRYVNMCLKQGLLAVGCSGTYDASKCPTTIAMPINWGCNMMNSIVSQLGPSTMTLLTNIWPQNQYLYASNAQGSAQYPQSGYGYYPVCGKWV